jgi:hypothetical protein
MKELPNASRKLKMELYETARIKLEKNEWFIVK